MSGLKSNRLMIGAALLAIAGCSSALSQETPNTAIVTQGDGGLASTFEAAPPADEPLLDGAPPVAPPVIVAEAPPVVEPAPRAAAPEVKHVKARFTCDIDVDRTPSGLRVTPVVRSDRAMSGEYSLVITKSGSGGSSDISQGGPFDVGRGERVSLGSSEFSMERGATFRATLKVSADGRVVCRDISS